MGSNPIVAESAISFFLSFLLFLFFHFNPGWFFVWVHGPVSAVERQVNNAVRQIYVKVAGEPD